MSCLIRTDVTSVKFYNEFILAGIGSFLHVFSKDSNELKQKLRVLNGQKIYGIIPSASGDKILIFGGKQIAVVEVDLSNSTFSCGFEPIVCDDWIHSGIWVSEEKVSLLSAHNVVEVWNINNQSRESAKRSKENSILYSGLLIPLEDGVLVLSGTVFSEVLISCADEQPLHYLKGHKGVIFSITCDLKKKIIVTTSDDRSVRIWTAQTDINLNTVQSWKELKTIVCSHELYGHNARVMRNCITNDYIISVGEDSGICFWSLNGKLLRKISSHINASIWSVDANNDFVVTGGGDSGIIIHPLSILDEYNKNSTDIDLNITPKKVIFTAKRNIIAISDSNELIYYDVATKIKTEYILNHKSTYKLLSISSCKQLIAVADMLGKFDVFIENCRENVLTNIMDTNLDFGKIMSMHWAGNRHIVFCADGGKIIVITADSKNLDVFAKFELPKCKERWLTAVGIINDNLIAGDRCGNLHIFAKDAYHPIKTFKHINGRYGPTSINIKNSEFITTGREGTLKYFSLFQHKSSKDLDFQWIEKFVDKSHQYVCGFQERTFVVFDLINNIRVLEIKCGGGHRSWDIVRYIEKTDNNYEEFITFMYIKDSIIHSQTFQLSKIVSRNIISGTHSKEINCLKSYKCPIDNSITYLISGGEDTTLRLTSLNQNMELKDELIFRHLSSIRTVKIKELDNNSLLVISGGGRAQICIKKIIFRKINDKIDISADELVNHMIQGSDLEKNEYRKRGLICDPETRVMDIELYSTDNKLFIYAACSDGKIKIFTFDLQSSDFEIVNYSIDCICILRLKILELPSSRILFSAKTFKETAYYDIDGTNLNRLGSIFLHKSGVNCIDTKVISNSEFLMASGGDDNEVLLQKLRVDRNIIKAEELISNINHCSQVTSVILVDDLLVSASIDQRITIFKWSLNGLKCEFKRQVFSDVADVQGFELIASDEQSLTLCVFGKGVEVLVIPRPL